ncbi:MAG TPA: tetratricopeptide repeat protein [Blastocatellia bacterium]|nr:tetratricopeptide repeat protein [Blastocatellia bacterium]
MDIPQTLKESLSKGRVIPFIGAGVSMAVKEKGTANPLFPSWKVLLERAADRLDAEQKAKAAKLVRALLDNDEPDYLDAAERARKALGPIWFDFLKDQLDHRRERADDESLRLAEAIWKLGSNILITTNYDRVLHWACPQRDDLSVWDIQAPAEQGEALREGFPNPTLWHLHGYIKNAANLILTPDGYSRLYPEAGEVQFQAALATLKSFLSSYRFIFVGFSLDDQYFGMQLKQINEIFQGATGPHYVLAHKTQCDRIKSLDLSVIPVPFDDYGGPLLSLLADLGDIAAGRQPVGEGVELSSDSISGAGISGAGISSAGISGAPGVASYDPRNTVFYVPFRPKGDQVVGREEALLSVREQLTKGEPTPIGQAAALWGLGGLGKTQLAVEYAYRYKKEYPNGVIWLTADQDIDAQLTDLAEKAKWVAPKSEHKYKLETAQQRLRTYSDCLIIFDNLENPDAIKAYLPEPQANPHILVTSRIEQPGFTPIPLDLLNSELSLKLLLQGAGAAQQPVGAEEEKAAQEIANALHGLPLALELAGAYVSYRRVGWQEYRDLLKQSVKAALPVKFLGGSFTKHAKDLYSTLKINEEVLSEEPRLRDILDLLAWSGSASMGMSLMCALLDVRNQAELTNALGLATSIRLLQKVGKDSYSIHRLVAEMRREEIPLEGREVWINEICRRMGDWFQQRKEGYENLAGFEAEIDHLRTWQQHALTYAQKHASRLTWLQAYPSIHRGQYKETRKWVTKASELLERYKVEDPQLEADLLEDHGFCFYYSGGYKRALEHYEKSLSIRKQLFGERHVDTARSFDNIGNSYSGLGQLDLGLKNLEKALSIRLDLFGEHHADTALSFNNVGTAYASLGQVERALEYYEKALVIYIELFGEHHPDTALSYNNIGFSYSTRGQEESALEYYEKALDIYIKLFGERHPDPALSYNNIGASYSHQGQEERALAYYEKALNVRLEVFGEQHPDTALSYNNMGTSYSNLLQNERALGCYEKALKIRRELLGDLHPFTIDSFRAMAYTLSFLDRDSEALQLLDEILPNLPKDNPSYGAVVKCKDFIDVKLATAASQPDDAQNDEESKDNNDGK